MTWPEVQIETVCGPTGIRDPKEDPHAVFSYVDISSIDREKKLITQATKVVGSEAPSRARKEIKADDILVSTVRPNLNAVAMVPGYLDGQIASTGFCVLRPKPKLLRPRFLFYFSRTQDFVTSLSLRVRGAHYPAVSDEDIKKLTLPLPSPTEQARIVEILDEADEMRKQRAESDVKFSHVLPALFYKIFGDPATNPKNWPTSPLEEVVEIGTKLVDPNEHEYSDLPHIGGEQIEKETGRILSPQLVRDCGLRSGKFVFGPGHILYSKIRPYLNKVAYPRFQGVCSADIYPLAPKSNKLGPWYIVALLRSKAFLDYATVHSARLRMAKLNREQLGAFKVPIPDPQLSDSFETQAEQIAKLEPARFSQAEKINELFQILLASAFAGRLTATWREAHMKELSDEIEQQLKSLNQPRETQPC